MGIIDRFFGIKHMLPKGMKAENLPTSGSMYKEYIHMALPSVMEMVLISLIGMIDTIMVSSIGTDAVAAVGLVGQPRMIMLCIFFAMNVGVTAVIARRKGENRREDANLVLRNSMVIILALSFVLMAIMLPFSKQLMRFAGAEEGRTLEDSTAYFIILGIALPFNVLSMVICAAQRGVGNTKLTMYVNIASNLVNVLFNYLLINGIGPFPKLGVVGAALATGIGMVCGFILSVVSLFSGSKSDSFLRLTAHDSWKLNRESISDVTKVGSSAMLEQIAMRIGFFSYAKIVAGLGTDAFAAHQISMQFLNLSFCFADGLGIAGTSLVGQMLGRKRKDLSHIYGTIAQRFSLIVALCIATCCIILRGPLVSLFINSDANDNVRTLAETVLIIVAIFQPFQMIATVASGALRGAGDVRYTARVMVITVTLMRPILAFAAVYIIGDVMGNGNMALLGAWLASLADMATRMILMVRRYKGGKWHDIRV